MPLKKLLAGAAAATVLAAGLPQASWAEDADTAPSPSSRQTVTLITGDKVHLDGTAVTVDRPEGAPGAVEIQQVDGDTYVIPDEVLPLLAADRIDRRLFNVTDLIEQGYDDASSAALPVITTYQGAMPRALAPRGAKVTRALPSVKGAALEITKSQARDFWTANTATKLWLDGKAEASLKESVPQIGAPQAWAAGFDGTGVKVAVLDTGIDDTHPDFAGQIAQQASFVPNSAANKDVRGHGTHVASTIAGTGAASGGANKGVAPGADLMIGKVLGDDGFGQDSWIIAGMEWAAAQGADVVNLSLGSSIPDGGTDPMAQAVDRLSDQYGTLFVIAAGNAYSAGSIGSPGSAAKALTVGAVNKADARASFSSMGPLVKNYGLKPDLSAPGVAINAAHSAQNTSTTAPYWSLNGTSMATPHVAGAAAILAQKQPGWTGQQLKDALMSTAKALPYTPYEQGTGRLDVAAAINAGVTATGSVPVAFYDWPHADGDAKAERSIVYNNGGTADVTLDLASTGSDAITLSAQQVTVPAGGKAEVKLTVDPAKLAADTTLSGVVTATAGTSVLRTGYAAVKERELYDLTIKLRDRSGQPVADTIALGALGGSAYNYAVDGERTLRLPPGTYYAWTLMDVQGERPDELGVALLIDPEIPLAGTTEVVLDARKARKTAPEVRQPVSNRQWRMDFFRDAPTGTDMRAAYLMPIFYDTAYLSPTEPVTQGSFEYLTRWRRGEPPLLINAHGRQIIPTTQYGSSLTDGRSELWTVHAGKGSAADYAGLDAKGKLVIVDRSDEVAPAERAAQATAAGAVALLVVNDKPGVLSESYVGATIPVGTLHTSEAAAFAKPGRVILTQKPYASYVYDLVDRHEGVIPDRDLTFEPKNLAKIDSVYNSPTAPGEGNGYRYDLARVPGYGFAEREWFPDRRTEWVTTSTPWYENHTAVDWEVRQEPRTYEPSEQLTQEWFAPVARPRLGQSYWTPFRSGNNLQFNIPPWADGYAKHTGGGGGNEYDNMTIALHQGERLIRQQRGRALSAYAGITPEALPYRLVLDQKRSTWATSTKVHTEWTFTSAASAVDERSDIPLLQLDYGVRAHGARTVITLSSTTQEWLAGASKATQATLQVSYDDGVTWVDAPLTAGSAGSWTTTVPSGTLSFKATAEDGAGRTVSQEIIRAVIAK